MRRSYRKHSRQKIGNHRRQSRKPEIRVRESDPVPPKRLPPQKSSSPIEGYELIVSELVDLVESARRFSARSVNAVMTATYWEIGRRIVEVEQRGKKRAEYGEALLKKLASDLTARFGKGFGLANLKSIRKFFLTWPDPSLFGKRPDAV